MYTCTTVHVPDCTYITFIILNNPTLKWLQIGTRLQTALQSINPSKQVNKYTILFIYSEPKSQLGWLNLPHSHYYRQ